MGISTVASYRGAQVFEAVGLDAGPRRRVLHRHRHQARRHRPRRHRRGGRRPARRGVPGRRHPRRRTARLEIGGEYQWRREGEPHLFNPETVFRLQHATRTRRYDIFKQYTDAGRRAVRAADDPARPVRASRDGRAPAGPDRRGRAGRRDRQAVLHRRDVLRLDLPGGARDARHRDEPARRQVQHRRGRRGRRPAARPRAPQRHQAGRLRPLRRHQRVPGQRRRHPDQDGPGRQARRGRPAARPQGLPVDRQDPALHPRRRPDLAAAAPRHLLDRGPRPADPRPEERQPGGPHPREAGLRGRRRHGRRRRRPRRTPTSC